VSTIDAQQAGQRFDEEVKRLGGPTFVASIVGKSRNTIYNWVSTADMTVADLGKLAEAGMDVQYVLYGERSSVVRDESGEYAVRAYDRLAGFVQSDEARQIRVLVGGQEHFVDPDHYRWVPVLNVRVSGGPGGTAFGENIVAFNAYRREWLDKKGLHDAMLSEVTVTGESMSPELREGDTVLVNHSANELQGGAIYVIRQGEELLVKYLQPLPGGKIQVNSENSAAYPSYNIEPADFDSGECEIVGRVVRQGRDR